MSDRRGPIISSEGEICPGCLSPYTYKIGNFVTKTARIIPGCSHNLCEECIVTDGTNTGQVTCRYPSCSTQVLWTDRRVEEFLPNLFILGSVAYRQQTLPSAPDDASADIMENLEPLDDTCEMMCGECGHETADCLCQQCNLNLCDNCFDKIHKFVKSFAKHKKLPIATDFIEKKMVPFLKMTNCNDHSKMIQYVADDGGEGCDECVIFGKLKGLHVIPVKEMEGKARNDLKDKIVEGKDRLKQLRSVLSDLESEKVKEMSSSPENVAQEIKTHFSDCHSKLQTLEHSLYQKLQKDHTELNAWREEIESSVKSTASKIRELSNMIKFSEEALSKEFNPGTYDFNAMVNGLAKLEDDPCEALKINKPVSRCLKIEQSFVDILDNHVNFVDLLDNHVTINDDGISEVHQGPSIDAPEYSKGYNIKNCKVVISRIASGSSAANLFESPSPVPSLCGDISNDLTFEDGDHIGHTVETLVGQHVIEHRHDIDEAQSYDTTAWQSNDGKITTTKRLKLIKTGQRARHLLSHVEPPSTIFNSFSHPKPTLSVSEKSQDGNNNVNLCSDVNQLDAHKMRTLRRKKLSSSYFEGSDDDDKPPASKKVRNLTPSRSKCSNNVSDLSSPKENMSMIKPDSSKEVWNLFPSRGKAINNVSNLPFPKENMSKIKNRSSKKVTNPMPSRSNNSSDLSCPNENTIKIKSGTSKKVRKEMPSQSSGIKNIFDLPPSNENMYKVSNDLKDRCKTKCKICNEVYSLSSMNGHTRNKHNLKITEYKEIHGPFAIIDVVYHKCEICGKHVLLDCNALGNHVRNNHSMKIRPYVKEYMVRTKKLDRNQIKYKLSQKTDSSCNSKNHAKRSPNKKLIVQSKRKETRLSSRSIKNISGSLAKKSKFPRKEREAPLTEPQTFRKKSHNQVKRQYRPGKASLMEIRKFHKTTKIVVPQVPFFKVIKEAAKKAIDGNKRRSLKISADAMDCLRDAAEARWDELVVDTLYASRVKKKALLRKDVILASKIRGAWDRFS